jgi:methionine sulfoxide reductase heme-binding subunit
LKRDSLIRAAMHIGSWMPLMVLVVNYFGDNLTANPIQAAEQRTGLTALVLLMLSLACTPVHLLTGSNRVIKLRRPLGLYAFLYAAIHLFIFTVLDYGLDWQELINSLVEKRFILVGAAAFIALLLLAVTSFKWWMKKLGKNWRRLHALVYPAGALVVLHYGWSVKGDLLRLSGNIRQPLIYGLVLLFLLALRLPPVRRAVVRLRRRALASKVKVIRFLAKQPVPKG